MGSSGHCERNWGQRAGDDGDRYARARWFAEGKGRAYIGFSESMAAMGSSVDNVDVRLLSCGTENNVPLFFTDMVGVASGIDEGKRELAFELANVLVSEEVLTE